MILVFLMVGFVVVLLMIMYRMYMKIEQKDYRCRKCGWVGKDAQLKTEIIRKTLTTCYIQRCPNCGEVMEAWDGVDVRI